MVQFSDFVGYIPSGQLGIYVACILLSVSISSLCSGHVADVISRKYGILTGGLIVAIGTIISASANNFPALISAHLTSILAWRSPQRYRYLEWLPCHSPPVAGATWPVSRSS